MILDFEDVDTTKAQKLLEDLAVAKLRLEVIHAALLDRTDTNLASFMAESVETVDKALDFLDEILEDEFSEVD